MAMEPSELETHIHPFRKILYIVTKLFNMYTGSAPMTAGYIQVMIYGGIAIFNIRKCAIFPLQKRRKNSDAEEQEKN